MSFSLCLPRKWHLFEPIFGRKRLRRSFYFSAKCEIRRKIYSSRKKRPKAKTRNVEMIIEFYLKTT